MLSVREICFVAVRGFGTDLCFIRCCHDCGLSVMLKLVYLASVSRRHLVMCVAEGNILNETRQQFVGIAHITALNAYVSRESFR